MNNQAERAPKAQKANNGFWKGVLVGGAIGLGAGGLGGYYVTRKKMLKKAKEDVKRAYRRGYDKGEEEAEKDAREVIDELKSQVIVVDSTDPEDICKAIAEHEKKESERRKQEDAAREVYKEQLKENVIQLRQNNHTIAEIAQRMNIPESTALQILREAGLVEKIVTAEPDAKKSAEVLQEAYDDALIASQGEPDEWDLSIDGEEAKRKSEEREKYRDMVDDYQKHPENGPMHISRKEFEEEAYLEKDWVTYYAGDNVFSSDRDADTKLDAFTNFGVVNGNDLFTTRYLDDEDNDDINIVYIRNFALNSVYEVTRVKDSWARMMSGEAYLPQESGQNGEPGETVGDG